MNTSRSKVSLILGSALIVLIAFASFSSALAKRKPQVDPQAFHDAMRKLWEDHVTWTRLFIVSDLAGLPDKDQTATRLLQNQDDIGNAIKLFYGNAAGDQLTSLLRQHILTAAELLEAAKAGNTAAFDDAKTRWYANADEIATFLNAANPKAWPLDEMKAMMKDHLDLTLEEASARLNGDWSGDVAAYDKIHVQILGMADMLSQGIDMIRKKLQGG